MHSDLVICRCPTIRACKYATIVSIWSEVSVRGAGYSPTPCAQAGAEPAPSMKAGISAPVRPQLIVFLRAAASRRVVRRSAPAGDSSRSLSPFAKPPWQSEQPLPFHSSSPAFTLSSFCAAARLDHPSAMAMTINAAVPVLPLPWPQRWPDLRFIFIIFGLHLIRDQLFGELAAGFGL